MKTRVKSEAVIFLKMKGKESIAFSARVFDFIENKLLPEDKNIITFTYKEFLQARKMEDGKNVFKYLNKGKMRKFNKTGAACFPYISLDKCQYI